jgi:hypothetical protein
MKMWDFQLFHVKKPEGLTNMKLVEKTKKNCDGINFETEN